MNLKQGYATIDIRSPRELTRKTKELKTKDFDAVLFMREARDKISKDIADLSKDQIMEYFKKNTPKKRILPIDWKE